MMLKVFLLVVFAIPAFSSPVGCRCDEGYSTKRSKMTPEIIDFQLKVEETGVEYTEKIEVDKSKETEVFTVPAHPGVDRSDVMHDFKLNLTMLHFPESNLCYLLPLDKNAPKPKKLIEDQTRVQDIRGAVPSRRKDTKWEVIGEFLDRSVLSDEMAGFCGKSRIYRVQQMKESLSVTSIEEKAHARKKRSSGVNSLCPGGMTLAQVSSNCHDYRRRCKVTSSTCTKYYFCEGMDGIELRPRRTYVAVPAKCWQWHIWQGIVCCEYICVDGI